MKYIISESRLENLIELYLDSIFEPHERGKSQGNITWVKNKEHIASINMDYKIFFMHYSTIKNIQSMFSLPQYLITPIILNWLEKNYELQGYKIGILS